MQLASLKPRRASPWFFARLSVATVFVLGAASARVAAADDTKHAAGEAVYRTQCVRCHGKSGQGTADTYPDPLVGDKSVAQLTKLIHETMPDDAETKCSAEDSAAAAAYIYDAFYSAEARVRNNPVRVELSRLTVRQHHQVLADLIGSFRQPFEPGAEPGLHGKYYADRELNGAKIRFERTDPEVNFNWETWSPDPEQFDSQSFSIEWTGSILAPDSGDYVFAVRTSHATRLYVNNHETPLVDAWVQSGDDQQHSAEISLLGGRVYPIKLQFSRAKLGVNDDKDKDGKKKQFRRDVINSIALEWKRPNHTQEVIAPRYLGARPAPEVFVLAARFPPDDRSVGYERGTAISKSWDESTTEAALEAAGYIVDKLERLSGVRLDSARDEPRLRKFCLQFVERAFRRPLTEEQQKFYVQRQFEATPDREAALKRVVLLALKSPRFLYREVQGKKHDQFDVAARMSFEMWDSLPDRELLKAAQSGKLATREQISTQLERMMGDLRTRSKLREFFLGWLKVSQPRDLTKDAKLFPEFTPEVASDLRTSLELSINGLLDSPQADYRQLLLSDQMWLNGRLAKVYGVALPDDAAFQQVDFEPQRRAGILSHPYLLANLAYTGASSPIHRGVFVSRSVLGRVLRPPAQAVAPLPPDIHAELSTRDRVKLQTQPEACQGCHAMINPLGFTMENFDAIGRFRNIERDKQIDATGSYLTQSGQVAEFKGIKDLAEFVAASDESQAAFVKQLFHHTVKQPILAYGPKRQRELQAYFAKNNFDIKKLLVEIVAESAGKSAGEK